MCYFITLSGEGALIKGIVTAKKRLLVSRQGRPGSMILEDGVMTAHPWMTGGLDNSD